MSFWEWLVELVRRLRVARLRALSMEASSGAYSLAGFNANLTYARHLTMQALRGIFQWAGFNINLTKQKYTLGATRGLFAMTGRNAELTYTPAAEDSLGWLDNIFPMSIARGSFFDLSSHITGDTTDISTITANVSLPSGVTITNTPSWRIVASTGATTGTTSDDENAGSTPPSSDVTYFYRVKALDGGRGCFIVCATSWIEPAGRIRLIRERRS